MGKDHKYAEKMVCKALEVRIHKFDKSKEEQIG